jgi:hypothetical protein
MAINFVIDSIIYFAKVDKNGFGDRFSNEFINTVNINLARNLQERLDWERG